MKSPVSKKIGSIVVCLGLILCSAFLYTNCSKNGFNVASSGEANLASSEPSAVSVIFSKVPLNMVNANSISFSYEISGSNLSGVSAKCYLDQTLQADCSSPIDLTSMPDGDYTLTVDATNQNSLVLATAKRSFRLDRKAPILTINSAPSGTINSASVSVSFSVTDNFPNPVAYCSLDNAVFAVCTSPYNLSNLAQGAHNVKIYVQDAASNKSGTQTVSFSVNTAIAIPTVAISQMPAAFSNSASASFSFSGSSSNSTISSYQCSMDNSAFAACSSPQAYSSLAEGSHSFAVKAIDASGQSSAAANYSFAVDVTAPSAPVVSSNQMNPTKSTSLNLTFNSTDASGVAKYECKLDAGFFTACVSPQAFSGLSSTSHSFVVRATDKAGNVSTEGSYSIVVDTVAPVVTISSQPASSTQSTSASFAFSISDALSGVNLIECQLDAQTYASCVSPQAYSNLAVGSHTFNLRGTDKAGNSSVQSYSWSIAAASTPTPTPPPASSPTPTPAPAGGALVPVIAGGYQFTDPTYSRLYGPGVDFCDSIGNYVIGRGEPLGASYRFRAPRSGTITQLRQYWIDGTGYSLGTGGKILIQVYPDDGSANHYPNFNGSVLAEGTHTPGLVNGAFNTSVSRWNTPVTMTSYAPLVAGQLYHVVYTNIDPRADINYISVDLVVSAVENGPPTRWLSGIDWGGLYGQYNATTKTWTWDDRTLKPKTLYYAPILQVVLSDNSVFGYSIMETGNIQGRFYDTTSAMPVRETFKPSQSMSFSGLSFMTSASVAGSLKWEILDGTTVLASGMVTESVANSRIVGGVAIHKWYDITLPTTVNFAAGGTYYVQFTPQDSSHWIWGVSRNGSDYGFIWPVSFTESQAQHFYNGKWVNSDNYGPASPGGASNWRVVLHKK